ncbi:amidohydrolase family protein, partial [Eubacteriales bacterium DFI.9.88]|nr:amidohydrolase family protein [Eubacteriales bacterium DFI.9.88]
ADETFPLYSIVKAGARMSLGSDFPGDEYGPQPLNSIETGATRQLCGQPDSPVLQPEEERLPISELIKGFTETAAFQVRMYKKIGTIKAGKYADLVVLDQNLFDVNPY